MGWIGRDGVEVGRRVRPEAVSSASAAPRACSLCPARETHGERELLYDECDQDGQNRKRQVVPRVHRGDGPRHEVGRDQEAQDEGAPDRQEGRMPDVVRKVLELRG